MRIRVFHSTSRGESHLSSGKPCQDCSYSEAMAENGVCDLLVVSDGHGSDRFFRSERGSRIAGEVAAAAVPLFAKEFHPEVLPPLLSRGIAQVMDCESEDFTPQGDPNEGAFRQLARYIIARWHEAVMADWEGDPPDGETDRFPDQPPVVAYGCTLLLAFRTRDYWAALQLGDGDVVAFWPDGSWSQPVPWDGECVLNCTTSLCSHREDRFRYCYGTAQPVALFLSSDGVGGSFPYPDQLALFYESVLYRLARNPYGEVTQELARYLPDLSRTGSRDDMSLAFWVDDDAAPNYWYAVQRSRLQSMMGHLNHFKDEIKEKIAHLQDSLTMLSQCLSDYQMPAWQGEEKLDKDTNND